MRNISSGFFLLCITGLAACRENTAPKAGNTKQDQTRRNDSIAADAINHTDDFRAFMERQIDTHNMMPDDDWKKALGADTGRWIIYNKMQDDDTDPVYHFPFTDINMGYTTVHYGIENDPEHSCADGSQFIINGFKLPLDKDCSRCGPLITPLTIRRYKYRSLKIITMWGGLQQYNGYGDRIQFNYFFDITGKPAQDIFTNGDGHVYHPNLYGDLNDDTLPDRLVYDGFVYPCENDSCPVTIKAETYRNKKWQPLKDAKNRPYFIKVLTDGNMDGYHISDYNWMKALK